MNKLQLLTLALCALMAPVANAKVKLTSQTRPGKVDISASLDNARKSLAHFAESTEDRELAQTLSDISKTLKTAKKNPTSITKKDVEHTFSAIEEITHKIDNAHDEAGFSNNCGCQKDCCKDLKKLLCQIKNIIVKCCRHLSKEIEEIKKLINTKFPCAHSIKIDHVPFTITKPGKYCVTKDLIFADAGAAITVAASNVTLNFANHSLTLTDPSAVGISAAGVSELVIQNDVIQSATESNDSNSAAILLTETNKVTIDNVYTLNTFIGIRALNSNDLKVTNSLFEHHRGISPLRASAAIRAESCNNVVVEECSFKDNFSSDGGNSSVGVQFRAVVGTDISSNNCRISSCEFFNTPIAVQKANGVIIEDCSSTVTQPDIGTNMLQMGAFKTPATDFIANDVIVRNCTFTYFNPAADFDAIIISRANGVLLEDCLIDTNPAGNPSNPFAAALHISARRDTGDPSAVATDVVVRNCIIENNPNYGISCEKESSKIVIDNCLVTGAVTANIIFEETIDSTIKNSEITNGTGHGIWLRDNSNNNALLSNVISDNAKDGIRIGQLAFNNLIKNNNAFVNGHIGLHNVDTTDTTNQFYINDACHNLGGNCVGINPPTLVGFPGGPVTNGINICCITNTTIT